MLTMQGPMRSNRETKGPKKGEAKKAMTRCFPMTAILEWHIF
jgi:hypothetical protein